MARNMTTGEYVGEAGWLHNLGIAAAPLLKLRDLEACAFLEPFCPACSGRLDIQGRDEIATTRVMNETDECGGWHQDFALICPWCRRALLLSRVNWRERKKEDE